jgi:cytochrome c oxidase cbb3-type subunit 1
MTVNPGLNTRVNPKKLRPYDEPPKRRRSLIPGAPDSAATAFLVGAMLWLPLALGIGLLGALMRFVPLDFHLAMGIFGIGFDIDFNAALVDKAFANALVYGWLSNAGFAAATFMAPRLTGRRLAVEPLVVLGFLAWNGAALAGIGALYVFDQGPSSTLGSFPWFVHGGLAAGAFIVTASFLATVVPTLRTAYISIWFTGIALLSIMGFTGLNALIGLLDFVIGLPDLAVALGTLLTDRATILMWLLPMALASLYYVVPRATGQPLESHGLAILAWVAWLATAPLAVLSVAVDPVVPFIVTSLGSAVSIALLFPIAITVVNLVLSTRGRWTLLFGTGPVAFAAVSMAFLLAAVMLDGIGTLGSVRQHVGGTDWVRGAQLWALLGAFTLAGLAFSEHAVARVLHRDWGTTPLAAAQLWCTFAGATLAGLALMGAGMAEGSFRARAADPETIAAGLVGYEIAAFVGIGLAALGGLAALINLFLAYTSGQPVERAAPAQPAAVAAGH